MADSCHWYFWHWPISQAYSFLPQLHQPMLYLLIFALAQSISHHEHQSKEPFWGQTSLHGELLNSKRVHLDELDFAGLCFLWFDFCYLFGLSLALAVKLLSQKGWHMILRTASWWPWCLHDSVTVWPRLDSALFCSRLLLGDPWVLSAPPFSWVCKLRTPWPLWWIAKGLCHVRADSKWTAGSQRGSTPREGSWSCHT